jgi:hypothetical protein
LSPVALLDVEQALEELLGRALDVFEGWRLKSLQESILAESGVP